MRRLTTCCTLHNTHERAIPAAHRHGMQDHAAGARTFVRVNALIKLIRVWCLCQQCGRKLGKTLMLQSSNQEWGCCCSAASGVNASGRRCHIPLWYSQLWRGRHFLPHPASGQRLHSPILSFTAVPDLLAHHQLLLCPLLQLDARPGVLGLARTKFWPASAAAILLPFSAASRACAAAAGSRHHSMGITHHAYHPDQ